MDLLALEDYIASELFDELATKGASTEANARVQKLADAIAEYVMAERRDNEDLPTQMRFVREAIERAQYSVAGYVDPSP